MISVPRPMMTTPSTTTTSDCAGNVQHDLNTLTITLPALMALPTAHTTPILHKLTMVTIPKELDAINYFKHEDDNHR